MQTKRISLADMKGKLSRAQMRQIMGGGDTDETEGGIGDGCKGLKECTIESDCTLEPGCTKCKNGVCAD